MNTAENRRAAGAGLGASSTNESAGEPNGHIKESRP